jgi:hypothetical protein
MKTSFIEVTRDADKRDGNREQFAMGLYERLQRYAREASDSAATAPNDELKKIYLENAAAWSRLAEAQIDQPPSPSDAIDLQLLAEAAV